MRDSKTFLMALLSMMLVITWIYHLYDKSQYSQRRTEIYIKDSIAVAQGVQDSLRKIFAVTINDLDTRLASSRTKADSLKYQLEFRMTEINKLRAEIDAILKNRGASKEDLNLARKKINDLQGMVDDLRDQKATMEEEKIELTGIMTQLSGEIEQLQQNMKRLSEENKMLTEKVNQASVFVATSIDITPVGLKNGKEQETNTADKTSKLIVSFAVQNNLNQYSNADIYVVITKPDGQILQNEDIWETSSMNLHNGAKMPFTRKIRFEYEKGENKKLLFSVNADDYQRGTYTLQLFHNGYKIGQASRKLG